MICTGAEPPRREERERARSRARESSRSRRDPSSGRRDKDRDEPRDRPPRGDRDRDDHRREKDDSRRDRDADSEDDPRRWRDDGKREERLASRRDRRDKATGDSWDASGDKRWAPGEDRDGRYKKASGGRDRKTNGLDDLKDKDDRRDKEREKEKEPAWMDTYVPSESSPGILGGQAPTGELDGIQAWKKGLKEREHKEKDSINLVAPKAAEPPQPPLPENAEKLDEIQLFKLIMKKEQETKRPDEGESFPPTATKTEDSASQPWQRGAEGIPSIFLLFSTPHSQLPIIHRCPWWSAFEYHPQARCFPSFQTLLPISRTIPSWSERFIYHCCTIVTARRIHTRQGTFVRPRNIPTCGQTIDRLRLSW